MGALTLTSLAAALVFTALFFVCRRHGRLRSAVFTATLALWGATLM